MQSTIYFKEYNRSLIYKSFSRLKMAMSYSDIWKCIIIVPTIADCYLALGIFHTMFQTIPNSFSDHIALNEYNKPQCLYTRIYSNHEIFNLEIKTKATQQKELYGITLDLTHKRLPALKIQHGYNKFYHGKRKKLI